MPIRYQGSIISLYKEQDALLGRAIDDLKLENEEYGISVVLELPEDDVNYDIGNFEVEISFRYNNEQKYNLKNMAMLRYYSPISRIARSLFRLPLIVLGLLAETQDVKIDFHHNVKNSKDIQDILINITPSSLRVYSVAINFEVKLRGVRELMQKYFLFSFFLGSSTIFLGLFSVFLILVSMKYEVTPIPTEESPRDYIHPKEDTVADPPDFSMILKPPPKPQSTFARYSSILIR